MKEFKYVTDNEIACQNFDDARILAETLIRNGYVVMISAEERLYIVNYIWSYNNADRNTICFQNREEVEDFIYNRKENEDE